MANTQNGKKNVKRNKTGRKLCAQPNEKIRDVTSTMTGESKQATLIRLLERPIGATIDEMAEATGWQRHSVRGMMSGVLKKRLGRSITSEKEERGRIYRMAAI